MRYYRESLKKRHAWLINSMENDLPIKDHQNGYVRNASNSYKSRVDSNSNLCGKLISFSNCPKKLYLRSKKANDRNTPSLENQRRVTTYKK